MECPEEHIYYHRLSPPFEAQNTNCEVVEFIDRLLMLSRALQTPRDEESWIRFGRNLKEVLSLAIRIDEAHPEGLQADMRRLARLSEG